VGVEEGGWCQYKNNEEKNKEAKLQNRFQDKDGEHAEQYKKVKAIWSHFAMDEMLLQLYHPFHSQKNESLNFHEI